MKILKVYFKDFLSLFFPELCAGCSVNLVKNEQSLCVSCVFQLPRTNFQLGPDNPVARELWGRFPFVSAGSFVFFQKGSRVQRIIHKLKYSGRHDSGFKMGQLYGADLKQAGKTEDIDLIIPVPIHPRKRRQRGYNQSEYIAKGLSQMLKIPVSTNHLIKRTYTVSQTKKSRIERHDNLQQTFWLENGHELQGKHVLLVDDVLTTGATLEACANALLQTEQIRISIASIAFTRTA